jgi:hypothetical protein
MVLLSPWAVLGIAVLTVLPMWHCSTSLTLPCVGLAVPCICAVVMSACVWHPNAAAVCVFVAVAVAVAVAVQCA